MSKLGIILCLLPVVFFVLIAGLIIWDQQDEDRFEVPPTVSCRVEGERCELGVVVRYFLLVLFVLALMVLMWGGYETLRSAIVGRWRLTMQATLVVVLVPLLFIVTMFFKFSYVDPVPKVVACTGEQITPMMEVTVESPRDNGIITERNALGCSFYYFEARGVGD